MTAVRTDDHTDNLATLLALGVVAYVGETLLHEGLGHGGACLVSGAHIVLLAPLWMRCSVDNDLIVLAGPAANLLAAGVYWAWIWLAPPRGPALRQLLWLSFAFNALVACGYLVVGGVSGFGDWGVLFRAVHPAALWRIPAALVGVAGYAAGLGLAASAWRHLHGPGQITRRRLWARTVVPGLGAAVVACAAEIFGGRAQVGPLLLALGCSLVVGVSLTRMWGLEPPSPDQAGAPADIRFSPVLVAAGLAVAAVFVIVIGPGANLSRLG